MDLKPSVAEIHKNLLLRGAKDTVLVEKYAFEPEMSRKRICEIGKRLEDTEKIKEMQVHVIDKVTHQQMEESRENIQQQINALKKSFSEVVKQGSNSKGFQQRYTPKGSGNNHWQRNTERSQQPNIKCWSCGETGHFKQSCPEIECFYCGERGHMARNCRKRRKFRQTCNECGNTGHISMNCALRRQKRGTNINTLDDCSETISTIHEVDPKNDDRLTVLGNAVSQQSVQ